MAWSRALTIDLGESQKSTIPRAVPHVGLLNTVAFMDGRNSLQQNVIVSVCEMGAAQNCQYHTGEIRCDVLESVDEASMATTQKDHQTAATLQNKRHIV